MGITEQRRHTGVISASGLGFLASESYNANISAKQGIANIEHL